MFKKQSMLKKILIVAAVLVGGVVLYKKVDVVREKVDWLLSKIGM